MKLTILLVVLALAVWVWGEFVQRGEARRGLAMGLSLLLAGSAYAYALEGQLHWRNPAKPAEAGAIPKSGAEGIDWQPWSLEAAAKARAEGFEVAASREAFFESADVLSLHIKSNDATRGIITAADLARMKPTSLLVNTSRAPIIEDGALVAALKKGRPGFAAIDVFEDEPVLGGNHPLLKMSNVLCTPHIGGNTIESLEKAETFLAGRVVAVLEELGVKTVSS